jgi:hypothetical protein
MQISEKKTIDTAYLLTLLLPIVAAILLRLQGRVWWCKIGDYAIWSSDIWGSHNSQHLFDPYTFTHILHGVLYFWLTSLFLRNLPLPWKFFVAILIAGSWEILENSSFVIEHYRTETISLDYYGDSVINSISDIFSCAFGFWLTYYLKFWRSLAFFVIVEIILLFTIRDSLIVNIIMLVFPIDAIKNWQMGH